MDAQQLMLFLSPTAPRRLRVIENILVGKRTVSTLYWGMRYQQLPWLGYQKQLSRDEMNRAVADLQSRGDVKLDQTNATLTPQGIQSWQDLMQGSYQPKYFSVRLVIDTATLWQRLLLATQVVSEQSYQNHQYYPLQVTWQVKQFIKHWFHRFHRQELQAEFNTFWTAFFTQLPEQQALLMSRMLVGHQRPGETLGQIAHDFKVSESEAKVIVTDLICQLAKRISDCEADSIKSLLMGLNQPLVSASAQQTLQSYLAGTTLEKISQQRSLKLSTVREHLLEAAIMLPKGQFDFQRVLQPELVAEMEKQLAKTPLDAWQFKQVEDLPIDFWQFRLLEILRSKSTDDNH